jgi:HEAT repeat protein
MDDRDDDVLRWLQERPLQDNPEWLGQSERQVSSSLVDWVARGKAMPDAENRLVGILEQQEDPVIRSGAALALGLMGADRSIEPLTKALKTDLPVVGMEAAAALGRLGRAEATEPLCAALSHPDANVRANACSALGALGNARALTCLRSAAQDNDPFVRAAANEALSRPK